MISQQVPDLPLDIIEDILTRLPVKTLIKFRCVSKLFLSLISNEKFIDIHLNKSCENSCSARVILCSNQPRVALKSYSLHSVHDSHPHNSEDHDYPLKDTGISVLLVGSINGLVCIAIENDLFIWNPSTRVSKKLPKMGLERVVASTLYGFGYDERNYDYKVVRIFAIVGEQNLTNTLVYSSRAASWKTVMEFPSKAITKIPGTFLNDSLHWLEKKSLELPHVIVTFDLLNETYSELEKPTYGGVCHVALGALQGCLCVMLDFILKSRCELWVMKKYRVRDSWVKLCAIPKLIPPRLGVSYSFPLSISSSGELFMGFGNDFILYNPSNGMFRVPRVPEFQTKFDRGVTYVESLVSPILNDC